MKPENNLNNISPEQLPTQYGVGVERGSGLEKPESGINNGAERAEQRSDTGAIVADIGMITSQATQTTDDGVVDDTTTDDMPLIANDDDLIEKEWVDKAKKIVAETQDNPHKREKEVNKLQVDYLKKRYGREIGVGE